MSRKATGAGRPRTSSRALIEDAAAELFLENTYGATTIDQIAQRAGVSRNTFFNYFDAKSDLLWLEVDRGIDMLAAELVIADVAGGVLQAVRAAMLRVTAQFGADQVPLALTQSEVMGVREEALSSGLLRYSRRAEVIASFVCARTAAVPGSIVVLVVTRSISAAVSAAWEAWAAAGIARGPLSDYVAEAFDLVVNDMAGAIETMADTAAPTVN